MNEWKADISRAFGGQGGDAAVRFSFDGVFGVGEASNGAEVVADNPEGVTDMVVKCGFHVSAAKEVVSIRVHEVVTTDAAREVSDALWHHREAKLALEEDGKVSIIESGVLFLAVVEVERDGSVGAEDGWKGKKMDGRGSKKPSGKKCA